MNRQRRCGTYMQWTITQHKKEQIWVSSSEVDELRACCIERSKSEREKQILYINAYIWNLKKQYWWNCFQGRNGDADIENRLVDSVGKRERDEWREEHRHLYTIMCEIDSCWEVATFNRQPRPVLCDNLEGLDGRREAQEGGYMCIAMTDLRCCIAETNTKF